MVIKNVKLRWAFISRPDEQGNFRATFEVTPEQEAEIDAELDALCKENNKQLDKVDWRGSKKVSDNGIITYSAKCAKVFKNKQGEEIQRDLPVYDKKAVRLEEVPNIANGAIANLDVNFYYAKYKQKCGVMISLKAVQLIKFEEYNGVNNFEPVDDDTSSSVSDDSLDELFQ